MFYFTRNFERQNLRLRKANKIYNADVDADENTDADAEMSMPRFPHGHLELFCEMACPKKKMNVHKKMSVVESRLDKIKG